MESPLILPRGRVWYVHTDILQLLLFDDLTIYKGVVLEVIELVIQVMFAVPLFLMALANVLAGVIWVGILPIVFAAYLITECVFVALSLSMARDTPSSWKFV